MQPDELARHIDEAAVAWDARVQDPASIWMRPGCDLLLHQDQQLPGGRTHAQIVWRAMAAAGEHSASGYFMRAGSEWGVRTKASLTLARTTMLGAAKALYLLEPDDAETRIIRALLLLRTEAQDVHRLVKNWEDATPPMVDTLTSALRQEADSLTAKTQEELVRLGRKPDSKISEIELLTAAAAHLEDRLNDPQTRIGELWNVGSGNAHARSWSWDTGLEDDVPANQVVRVWRIPLDLLDTAWDLWNVRRGAEPASPEASRALEG